MTLIRLSHVAVVLVVASPALAGPPLGDANEGRYEPLPVTDKNVAQLRASMIPVAAGGCPIITSTHTNADFGGGSFMAQGGFAEDEVAAASYTLSADAFPLQVDLAEMIFATSGTVVTTTTHWSFLVWEGTPQNGTLIGEFSSDDKILPHLVIPPGTNGVNIQVSVDPGDPEQIIVTDNGSQTFSIGYRIDQHNSQSGSPCLTAPPATSNAFPTTDVGGLANAGQNWLFGVNCGPAGCPSNGGWASFQSLPIFCRPSGDWVMRATWHSLSCSGDLGACCLPDTSCLDDNNENCLNAGGNFLGAGVFCFTSPCPTLIGACCFEGGDCAEPVTTEECSNAGGVWQGPDTTCTGEPCSETGACCIPATGGCIDLSDNDCTVVSGVYQGLGSGCDTTVCFPTGACCLIDATCLDEQSPDDCALAGGVYQGNDASCGSVTCPDPTGACCVPGGCLVLSEDDCGIVAGTWTTGGSDCADGDGSGSADACETSCPADLDGDNAVAFSDLLLILSSWGPCDAECPEDLDDSGDVAFPDLLMVLSSWGDC